MLPPPNETVRIVRHLVAALPLIFGIATSNSAPQEWNNTKNITETGPVNSAQMKIVCHREEQESATGKLISIFEFGAKPNDSIQDDQGIQEAIDTAPPNSTIVFPPGLYIQTKSIYIRREGLRITGAGATLHATDPEDQTIRIQANNISINDLTLTAKAERRGSKPNQSRISSYLPLKNDGSDKIQLRHIAIENITIKPSSDSAKSATAAGIFIYNTACFRVSRNTIQSTGADGIHISGRSRYGEITENHLQGTGDDMIGIVSYLGRGWRDQLNRKNSKWKQAIIDGDLATSDINITNNTLKKNIWGRGIAIVGGKNINISSNNISDTPAAAILIARERSYETQGVSNITIANNKISNVGQTERVIDSPNEAPSNSHLRLALQKPTYIGHGAIEVNGDMQSEIQSEDASLRESLQIRNISIHNNSIHDTAAAAIRVHTKSPSFMKSISVKDNEVARTKGNFILAIPDSR